MKERNHLSGVVTTDKLHLIDDGIANIPMLSLLRADGHLEDESFALNKETAIHILHAMQYTRILDERMVAAQRQGRISFYLACTGEEAAVVASTAALSSKDMVMSQYREQGALTCRGYTPEQFMNQMFSNELDPNKGRQMPIHYGDKALNFMTVSSPLGTQIPQAAGYAFGQKMSGEPAVTICFFGEGAASEGDFHAGLNMAAVLKCPTIFFCRNNGYAISTPAEEQFVGDGIASRGIGYGVRTIRVDGNDAIAVYQATKKAREVALQEECPVLIEAMTYRLAAHSTSDDPSSYRAKDEEEAWQDKDPIARLTAWLEGKGWFNKEENEAYKQALREEVLSALKQAEKESICPIEEITQDVYDAPPWHLQEQLQQLKEHVTKHPSAYPKTSGRMSNG